MVKVNGMYIGAVPARKAAAQPELCASYSPYIK